MVIRKTTNQTRRCSSSKERGTVTNTLKNTDTRTVQFHKSLPRKSAYYGNKTNIKEADDRKTDEEKSRATSPVKPKDNDSQKMKLNTATAEKQSPPLKDSIFKAPVRNHAELAQDIIRADCMNHGYRIEKTIGEGAYAKVKLAEVLPSKMARNVKLADMAHACQDEILFVAIKVIESKNVPKEFLKKFLPRELGNHCPLPPHKNVVEVFEQFRTTDRYYVVMEYCSRGDLLDLINQKISESSKGVGEDRARSLFKMMAEGVHHIHSNGIVHRDLKCENILLNHENNIKITDFGFSTNFIPEKTALLKTSCGSYAYTAPEVIRMKPYDGTKSDAWSLGIILFAMLNGRLPFNDAQLSELEEDMKMQRLRFERTVSFESMVLVRKILQYNPTSRPSTAEILSDPWLTGKQLIPRQINKPKWVNPYHKRDDEEVKGVNKATNPIYFKATIPERGSDGTVTVNHDKNETVVLKSRAGNKKNIWTSGPPVSGRPNTWPQQYKAKQAEARPTKRSRDPKYKKTKSTAVVKQQDVTRKGQGYTGKDHSTKKDYASNMKYTKWFVDKYMTPKDPIKDQDAVSNSCSCCKAEAAFAKLDKQANYDDIEPELSFLDNKDDVTQDVDDFWFPSPVKNVGDLIMEDLQHSEKPKGFTSNLGKTDKAKKTSSETAKPDRSSINSRTEKTSACSNRLSAKTARKPTLRSSSVTQGQSAIKKTGYTSPVMSKSVEHPKQSLLQYIANRSKSPAARVKYFRDRLMELYWQEENGQNNLNGLPPLMVQALRPPKSQPGSREAPASAPPGKDRKQKRSTSSGKTRCKSSTIKPVQRVIVH